MKKTLIEELERIHSLTYGKTNLQEQGILDKILSSVGLNKEKKSDDPKKADLVTDEVDGFYSNLERAKQSNGISQQEKGSMNFQKDVESVQIGLMLLGYQLPKHGVDGLFGPETANAVTMFKKDHLQMNESASELRSTLSSLGYSEKSGQLSSGGEITRDISSIVSEILKDYKKVNPKVKVIVTSGNDKFHQKLSYSSKHAEGDAVDLVLQPYNTQNAQAFLDILNSYKTKDSNFSFIDEYTNPSKASTGGHFHLQYGPSTKSTSTMEVVTPEMLTKMIDLLKERGVTSEDLKKYIDPITSGGGFTALDLTKEEDIKKYVKICETFISSKQPNPLGITGEMMAKGAIQALEKYGKFVPAELALAQLATEGGIGNGDLQSRPIRTKNPFNVGNVDDGSNEYQSSVQSGINRYYDLIAKDYLGKGKSAKDLINDFTNKKGQRYATDKDYEIKVSNLAMTANKIANRVTA
jgi:peptidoglycan hydrolase-like protein with peptidoglycan-binding domain